MSARGREIAPALPGAHHPDCRCPDCELDRYWERREAAHEARRLLGAMAEDVPGRCEACRSGGVAVVAVVVGEATSHLCLDCADLEGAA